MKHQFRLLNARFLTASLTISLFGCLLFGPQFQSTSSNAVMAQEREYPAINVRFHTNDDDKDNDTVIVIYVKSGDGDVVAEVEGTYGHFGDNSDSGIYNLTIVNTITEDKLQGCSATITTKRSAGHDRWSFNLKIEFTFIETATTGDQKGPTLTFIGERKGITADENYITNCRLEARASR